MMFNDIIIIIHIFTLLKVGWTYNQFERKKISTFEMADLNVAIGIKLCGFIYLLIFSIKKL